MVDVQAVTFSRFPARLVTSAGQRHDPAAVVVTGERVVVAVDKRSPRVVADRRDVVRVERLISRATEIEFADGEVWTVTKGQGCSCSSPIKRWYGDRLRDAG